MLFADKVIGVSDEIVNNLKEGGIPRRKLKLIHNGIRIIPYAKLDRGGQEKLRKELGMRKNSLVIGSLGRLTKQKDYKTLIRAAARILEVRGDVDFIIAGEGKLRSELVALCKRLGIDGCFHFIGFRDDIGPILELMDIFVLCSLDEGLPMAMLEAMGIGLPVVATRVGDIPVVVKNEENGLLIEKGDCDGLKRSLLLLIRDSKIRDRLGKRAYNTVGREFSIEPMTQKYLNIYGEIVLSS